MLRLSYVPEGNQARVHFWSVHRDARNFTHATTYLPERWLIAEGLESTPPSFVHNRNAFVPFSFGPANCVGKNLAMQEMRELLCHFIHELTVRFADGCNPAQYEEEMADWFVCSIGHLPVVVERRC